MVAIGRPLSEPIVRNAPSISRQIFERIETIEVVNGDRRNLPRFRQAQVHGDATAPCLVKLPRSPKCHAAAVRAEVELDCLSPDVALGRAGDIDSFALIVICPERPVAATNSAIAGSGGLGHSAEAPANGTAMAGSLDHLVTWSPVFLGRIVSAESVQ